MGVYILTTIAHTSTHSHAHSHWFPKIITFDAIWCRPFFNHRISYTIYLLNRKIFRHISVFAQRAIRVVGVFRPQTRLYECDDECFAIDGWRINMVQLLSIIVECVSRNTYRALSYVFFIRLYIFFWCEKAKKGHGITSAEKNYYWCAENVS